MDVTVEYLTSTEYVKLHMQQFFGITLVLFDYYTFHYQSSN